MGASPGCYSCSPVTIADWKLAATSVWRRLIEQNKERYYEVLEQSSQRWNEGKHDPWPTMNFLLFILTEAYKEFELRDGQLKSPRGEKTAMVLAAIDRQVATFRVWRTCSPNVPAS